MVPRMSTRRGFVDSVSAVSNRRPVLAAVSAVFVSSILLGGCAEQPAGVPVATSPAVSEQPAVGADDVSDSVPSPAPIAATALENWTVSPDGVGPLLIGAQLSSDDYEGIVKWNPIACEYPELGFSGGLWEPAARYLHQSLWDFPGAFGVDVSADNTVLRVDVFTDEIRTSGDIGLGSTRAQLVEAHPEAVVAKSTDSVDIYAMEGSRGVLILEVAKVEGLFSPWPDGPIDIVQSIRVSEPLDDFDRLSSSANSDDVAGSCL